MAAPPVLLFTSWHLRHMRSMPRAFWAARSLERRTKTAPGCLRIDRWVSRRSILLTSWWRGRAEAEAWLASQPFRDLDARLRSLRGTETRLELHERPPEN